MNDTLIRQWHMLRAIPRSPSSITTSELLQALANEGFQVTSRTLQRDLMKLSAMFPLECEEDCKPFAWSWSASARYLEIPGMDSHVALVLWMVKKHLERLLPGATLSHLDDHFERAERVLDGIKTEHGAPAWRSKVRVLSPGFSLTSALVCSEVQSQVYSALLKHRQLRVRYKARESLFVKSYELNPLGLVLRDGIDYLVCSIQSYQDIRLLTLHRMEVAQVLDQPLSIPEGFDLDEYIQSGVLGFRCKGLIQLQALFTKGAAYHLYERALSDDQKMEEQEDGRILVTATVQDTSELRWWLRSFLYHVEVLQPQSIRDEMIRDIKKAQAVYER